MGPVGFALLVVVTVVAFAVAQSFKGEPLVLDKLRITGAFTPNGDGIRDRARIRFRLTRPDRVNVEIVDARGKLVRNLARNRELRDFRFFTFRWAGHTLTGAAAPPGRYRLRVRMLGEDRNLLIGRAIVLSRPRARNGPAQRSGSTEPRA